MANKSSRNGSKSWAQDAGSTKPIEVTHTVGIQPFSFPKDQIKRPCILDEYLLYPSTGGEMLQLNDYQVALVFRSEWDCLERSRINPVSDEPPTVLLPFSWRELVAGVHQFARKTSSLAPIRVSRFDNIRVDFHKIQVTHVSGKVIALTKQEFKTLAYFLSNPERVISRDELLNEAWGYENYPSTRTVDNHVLKLRQKLERDPARPVHFRTVHGFGYIFAP